jgi:HK97 family phage prohead protease
MDDDPTTPAAGDAPVDNAAAAAAAVASVAESDEPGTGAVVERSQVPAALRALTLEERAAYPEARVELRHAAGKPPQIDGHALVYNRWSEDLGGFKERILPGAATASIDGGADVRGLFNHDPNYILGRSVAKTLTLEDQPKGLRYVIDPPTTPTINDLVLAPMGRGELTQSSFQFITTDDEWREPSKSGGLWERDLIAFDLIDVSPVTFPAYPQTDAGLRTRIAQELGIPVDALTQLLARALRGDGTSERDERLLRDAAAVAATTTPAAPAAITPATTPIRADTAWNQRMKGLLRR